MELNVEYKGKIEDYYLFTYNVDGMEEMMVVKDIHDNRYELTLSIASGGSPLLKDKMKMNIEKASNLGLDILSAILKNDPTIDEE
jgi:hypothetical protein